MSITIAIAGKGGTGKSTIAALLIRWLNEKGVKSILAVDADSNTNLHDLLGLDPPSTIGAIREELKDKVDNLPGGMTKQQFFEYKINQALIETAGYDLIAMGRPEGPGCYCYANNLLRDILKSISDQYQYVIIDNEAGMEHLSRRTVQKIDYLLIVSDATVRGIQTAGRLNRLLQELNTRVKRRSLIINRAENGKITVPVFWQVRDESLRILAVFKEDKIIKDMDREGGSIYFIDKRTQIFQEFDKTFSKLLKIK